jgi:hypothetical protein
MEDLLDQRVRQAASPAVRWATMGCVSDALFKARKD